MKNKQRQKKAQEAERAQAIEQALKEQEASVMKFILGMTPNTSDI